MSYPNLKIQKKKEYNPLLNELEKSCEKRADEAWGYDWERETYDACVLGRFLVNDIRDRLNNESD